MHVYAYINIELIIHSNIKKLEYMPVNINGVELWAMAILVVAHISYGMSQIISLVYSNWYIAKNS